MLALAFEQIVAVPAQFPFERTQFLLERFGIAQAARYLEHFALQRHHQRAHQHFLRNPTCVPSMCRGLRACNGDGHRRQSNGFGDPICEVIVGGLAA